MVATRSQLRANVPPTSSTRGSNETKRNQSQPDYGSSKRSRLSEATPGPSHRGSRPRRASVKNDTGSPQQAEASTAQGDNAPCNRILQHPPNTTASDVIGPLSISPIDPAHFGLIQERLPSSFTPGTPTHIFALLVQSILWNQTPGRAARPVLAVILSRWPTPSLLAAADEGELEVLLRPLGLWRQRAKRLRALGAAWLARPPEGGKRYRRVDYPLKGNGRDVRPGEVLLDGDERIGWEVADLPGVGPYALDSFRIFCRDGLRGVQEVPRGRANGGDLKQAQGRRLEAEWTRVLPTDKDLRKYLVWRWRKEGWTWDPLTGKKSWVGAANDEVLENLKER